MIRNVLVTVLLLALILTLGCSGGVGNVSAPDLPQEASREISNNSTHYLWGYWQGEIDPVNQTLDFVRLREGTFHLNAIVFLEPPPLLNLTLESLEFNGNLVTADIGFRHPFLGLTEFTGFDVCGIFISDGSVSGFTDSNLLMTGPGDMRLLNPDGLGRWWNPTEFPSDGSMFGYKDGLLGAPDSVADFSGTLNGYKYFCDDLSVSTDPMSNVDPVGRGVFSAGQKNVRRYELEVGSEGLIFNYAVDANWQFPNGAPPYAAPDDFGPEANRTEAWNVVVTELENSLYNDGASSGGDLSLSVDVYDWFNADLNTVRIESPGNFAMVESTTIIGSGPGFSTYQIDILDATPAEGSIDMLLSIVSEQPDFEGFIPGTNTTAYFTTSATVGIEAPASVTVEFGNPVTPFTNHTSWDEYSPCIAQDANNQLVAFWHSNIPPQNICGDIPGRSSNGINWSGGSNVFGTSPNGNYRFDVLKIAPRTTTGTFVVINFVFPTLVAFATDYGAYGGGYVFNAPGRTNNLELMVDASGYGYPCGDSGGTIRFQKTPNPNVPGNSTNYTLAPGRLSHVRSWGLDSSGLLYLAFLDTGLSEIVISHGTNTGNLTWTTPSTVFDDAGYDDIRDPSMHLVDDVIHLSFVRHDTSSGYYELCYTSADISDLIFSTPVVIDTSTTSIEDAHIQKGEFFASNTEVIGVAYQKENYVYFKFSSDAGTTWSDQQQINTLTNDTEDCDMIFLNTTGSLTETIIVIWAEDNGSGYRDIKTRMGSFVEG